MSNFVTTYQEFFTFDYASLHTSDSPSDKLYAMFDHPYVPFGAVLFYLLISNSIFDVIRKMFNLAPKGPVIQSITILHSSLLAVYSLWTCVNTVSIVVPHVMEVGFLPAMCDASGELWGAKGLSFWVTHFYLSKFYEFIDTWLIVLKGRQPIFLQTYHHAGVVLLMWGFVVTRNTAAGAILTCLNSFIHTLMYSYYVMAAFGINSPLKNYLTMAQMIQFLVGIAIVTPVYSCYNEAQAYNTAALQAYAIYLTYLFYCFYQENYIKKKAAAAGKDGKKKE